MITKEAIEAGMKAAIDKPLDEDDVERILTAAIAAMPGPAVRVKPLEWVDAPKFMGDDEVTYAEAVGAGYTYIAEAVDCTLEDAKAEREAEYEANIMAAIEPAPDLASENERLRAALEKLVKSADEVNRLGASTGPQWLKMTVAIVSARAALERT